MIDLSKNKKELSESAEYAIRWFEENGFEGKLITNNTNKLEIEVSKDGISDIFTLTATRQWSKKYDIKEYIKQFEKSFALKQEIQRLKSLLRRR